MCWENRVIELAFLASNSYASEVLVQSSEESEEESMSPTPIMFIDDDKDYLAFLKMACKKVDSLNVCCTACDGEEAIATLRARIGAKEELPHVIFVDINMPGMDGFGFLQAFAALRDEFPQELSNVRPVAMLTSSCQGRDRERAYELGADEYFVKPMDLADTREILQTLVS